MTETLVKVVVDCSAAVGLAASVPGILKQVAEAAEAGNVSQVQELLDLARDRAAAAQLAPEAVTVVELNDDELAQHALDQQAAAAAAAAAVDAAWAALRAKRDGWLLQTDWMFLDQLPTDTPAATLKAIEANKDAWTAFRQALRDITNGKATDPATVEWPTPPEAPAITLS